MEPLTLITTFVGPVSLDALVGALRGDAQTTIVTEFLNALAASEDRLHLRLAGLESRLDQIIAQSYTEPLGLGVRLLADAANISPALRRAEIRGARQLFLKAATATTTPLEVAVAERYALICALALDEDPGYARTAYDKLRHAAFTASIQAADTAGRSHDLACERLGPPPRQASDESARDRAARVKQEALVATEAAAIRAAAEETLDLAVAALLEANTFDVFFGRPAPPDIARLPADDPATAYLTRGRRWLVTPRRPGPAVRVGDLAVTWNAVDRVVAPAGRRMRVNRSSEFFPGLGRWLDERWPRSLPVPPEYLILDATTHALTDVPRTVLTRLHSTGYEIPVPPDDPDAAAVRGTASASLTAGDASRRVFAAFAPHPSSALCAHLVIHDTFVVGPPEVR